jgi:hypothetical protein
MKTLHESTIADLKSTAHLAGLRTSPASPMTKSMTHSAIYAASRTTLIKTPCVFTTPAYLTHATPTMASLWDW